jgi:hypothetical protein
MKCERAMELLATGTALGRLWARRHAARCTSCATEVARSARFANLLTTVEPLTPAQRALWTSASIEPRTAAAPSPWPGRVRLAAAAAGLILAVGLAFVAFGPSPVKPTVEPPVSPIVTTDKPRRQVAPEMIQELDTLTSDLHTLSQDLAQLSRQAELLDERTDAEALTRRFVVMNSP